MDLFSPTATVLQLAPLLNLSVQPPPQIVFQHAHYILPKEAEQYAILTQVNFQLPEGIETQNNWTVINNDAIHAGAYWEMPPHRSSVPIRISVVFSRIGIAIQKMLAA
uniref:Uncharacterized protein n=1 Tax=Tanacetum cinerariifolium TaxID=118510 RepID=A0A6L2KCN0_TANCI|nr:hypothetical protein [Tanacetum cinerariifolium]